MDNGEDLPGYKYYLTEDGARPAVRVVFLDLVQLPGASVNGILSPVDDEQLARLDRRERNYDRVDVTELIDAPPGRTWAYVGSVAGRRRRAEAEQRRNRSDPAGLPRQRARELRGARTRRVGVLRDLDGRPRPTPWPSYSG